MASRAAISLEGTARGQLALLVAAAVSLVCGVLISVIAARSTGSAEFGFFALVATMLPIARDATDLGTANVTARKIASAPDSEADALGELFAWRWIPALAAAAALGLMAATADGNTHRLILAGAALCALLYVNSGYVAFFQARLQMTVPALITIFTQTVTVALCAFLALTSAPPIAYPLLLLLREAASMVLLRFTAVQLFDCRHAPAKLEVQPLVSGAVTRVAVAALAYQLAVGCGPLLLDLFSTPTELGWYGAAFRLTAPLFALAWILATPLVPKLAAAAATQSFGETVERCAELPILLAAIGAGVLYVTAPVVVDLLFGAEFAPAAPVLQLLGIAAAANAMGAFIGTALIAAGRNRHVVGLGLATLAVALCLSILLVPQSGAKGAAEALLAGSLVTAIAAGASTVGAERAALLLLKVLLAGFIAWGAVAILPFGAFGELCAAGLVGAVLSALLVWRSHG